MSEANAKPLGAGSRLGLKVLIVVVAGLVLLVPLELVRGIILERAERAQEVTLEIADKWAAAQTLRGPFLLVPAERANANLPGSPPTRRLHVLLPDDFEAQVETTTETRSRGIFDAEIYTAAVKLSGSFKEALLDRSVLDGGWHLRPDEAMLVLGVSDARGLQEDLTLSWDGKDVEAAPGVPSAFLNLDGLHWPLQAFAGDDSDSFEIAMTLRGSSSFSILPAGRNSSLRVAGNWSSPSFDGIALPQSQEVGEAGFAAEWHISHLSRALPQTWNSAGAPLPEWQAAVIGVKFLDPVDFYRLSERSVKYGALFIALTFLVLFLFEVLLGLAVHPIQYLMVGAALVLFFLNLVAFAEVIGFAAAYAVSAFVVAAMISLYAAAVLRRRLWGSLLFATTAALYGLLFVILRMEEAALLSGSLMLLAALALTMFLTRRIDWQAAVKPAAPSKHVEAAGDAVL
jgi:inner membrane protein